MDELIKSELRNAARSIRKHNRIHSIKEPRAVYITQYLELAADLFEKIAEGKISLTKLDAPAVNRWIPVEEALPDSAEDVLVWFEYFRYGEYNCMYQTYNIGNYFANHDSWMVGHETGWQKLRVIAWMPLPEPPESEVQG